MRFEHFVGLAMIALVAVVGMVFAARETFGQRCEDQGHIVNSPGWVSCVADLRNGK